MSAPKLPPGAIALRTWAYERGWTMAELAAHLEVPCSTLSAWVNGDWRPMPATAQRIAERTNGAIPARIWLDR